MTFSVLFFTTLDDFITSMFMKPHSICTMCKTCPVIVFYNMNKVQISLITKAPEFGGLSLGCLADCQWLVLRHWHGNSFFIGNLALKPSLLKSSLLCILKQPKQLCAEKTGFQPTITANSPAESLISHSAIRHNWFKTCGSFFALIFASAWAILGFYV